MKIKSLFCAMIIVATFSGCLKDSSQPVNHVNDVNISLMGSWTQSSARITYYDETGTVLYSANVALVNLGFDNTSVLKETDTAGHTTTSTYHISTVGTSDYINVDGGPGTDQYTILSLQGRKLVLSEKLTYPEGATLSVGDNSFIYYSSVMLGTYIKKDLPRN